MFFKTNSSVCQNENVETMHQRERTGEDYQINLQLQLV